MSSGSYFPPAVLLVEIPKRDGCLRPLGIPTVSDRIAQMVVKIELEPNVEPFFHPNSYGYRANKSALEAIGVARGRCWRNNWVLDIDIKGFFDNIDHELMMRALKRHTSSKWILLYIARWLKAPVEKRDGTRIERSKGTPQGSVISPLLANLYLHYALDKWLQINYPHCQFERYADDIVIHCKTEKETLDLKSAIDNRLKQCCLELHPEKTKIVYCKDNNRKGEYTHTSFDFLGYTFQARSCRNKYGEYFLNFLPAISKESKKSIYERIRSWRLQLRSDITLQEIAKRINPIIRGWINYYGRYNRSTLYHIFFNLNRQLFKWAYRKYKKIRRSMSKAIIWFTRIAKENSQLFAHWEMLRILPTER